MFSLSSSVLMRFAGRSLAAALRFAGAASSCLTDGVLVVTSFEAAVASRALERVARAIFDATFCIK
jgi:hypothetical protein